MRDETENKAGEEKREEELSAYDKLFDDVKSRLEQLRGY
jgi:hypothetical protein